MSHSGSAFILCSSPSPPFSSSFFSPNCSPFLSISSASLFLLSFSLPLLLSLFLLLPFLHLFVFHSFFYLQSPIFLLHSPSILNFPLLLLCMFNSPVILFLHHTFFPAFFSLLLSFFYLAITPFFFLSFLLISAPW